MNCDQKNRTDLIEKYLLNELSNSEMREFEEHFLSCDECFEEIHATSQLTSFIKEEGHELFKEFTTQAERDSPFNLIDFLKGFFAFNFSAKPVLSYAFMAVFSGLIIFTVFSNQNDQIIGSKMDPDQLSELTRLYPAAFNPAADLEGLISQEFRSETSLDVKLPENNMVFNESVEFSWELNSGGKLNIKILDNNEKVIANSENLDGKFSLDVNAEGLTTGLYYWKLENSDDLMYVGRFYIYLK